MQAVTQVMDRSISVPRGAIIRTGYVDVFKVRLACRERMAVGDFAGAYQKRLQAGDTQPWPCPNGSWEGDTFVIVDGRHEWMACVALGITHLLVAWLDSEGAGHPFASSPVDSGSGEYRHAETERNLVGAPQ